MADVVHRTTLEHRRSVHTPDYPVRDWIINPKLPTADPKYWRVDGDTVVEMDAAGKAAVDASELAAYKVTRLETLKTAIAEKAASATAEYRTLKTAVDAARTKAEVDAVVVTQVVMP